jgi:hypothetical protein
LLFTACAAEGDLEWVAPLETDQVPVGDAIELAVATQSAEARSVRFEIDGAELAVCDPAQPEEDCKRDDVWRWTTVFDRPGMHELVATSLDADGNEVESVVRQIVVVPELAIDDQAIDPRDEIEPTVEEETPDDLPTLAAAGRGLLDPDRAYHRIFGGIAWRVVNQRVRLHSGTPKGSVADVRRCMNRFGASIRKWADHYHLSRASVAATALTESTCTNPAGSSDGLSSGPMQVTASTCAALMGLSRTTCRKRMHGNPDFSFQVGAKYMGSSYQRNQHHRDPPKIAAAYNAGSLRRSSANRWHLVSTGNHIDRFVRWYNAYRAWEAQ